MNIRYFIITILMSIISFSGYAQKNIKTDTFKVGGTCPMCKDRIESTVLKQLAKSANWDIESHQLTVKYDSTQVSSNKIKKALAEAGHDSEGYRAEDKTYNNLPACCHYDRLGKAEQTNKMTTTSFKVGGTCEMCKQRIEKTALAGLAESADWNVLSQTLTLSFDSTKTSANQIKQALAEAGHDSEGFRAEDKGYNSLPACCHYDRLTKVGQASKMTTTSFKVGGTCEMCKQRIEKTALAGLAESADWNVLSQTLTLNFDSTKTSANRIKQALASAGHDSEGFAAKNEDYNALPACCFYTRFTDSAKGEGKNYIVGVVLEESLKGRLTPLPAATIKSLTSNQSAISDSVGLFHIETEVPAKIVVSYVGFKSDTLEVNSTEMLSIVLKESASGKLREVVITSGNPSSYVSAMSVTNKLNINASELTKAACCNLSESFETSPSVDVSYSDAVTGVKQIKLLGLSGKYSQLLTENVPEIKGLTAHYGMTYIPGPWLEGIQLTKGVGSVVNGYESIAGQINVEEKKPDNSEKLYVNTYANTMGRLEANVNASHRLNDKWSTAMLLHGNYSDTKVDDNNDSFLDLPTGSQWNLINRWKYMDNNGWIAQFAIKAMNDKRYAGQLDFDRATDIGTTNAYGVGIEAQQYSFTSKVGYVFPAHKYKSIGFIFSAGRYSNDAYYGLTNYKGEQNTLYGNLIYQSIIGNTNHKFKTGISFSNEHYDETFNSRGFDRNEIIPGAFFEYTYTASEKLTAIAGLRADYHNLYGFIPTPRLHLKYDLTPRTNFRLSGGSGFRVSNIFAENVGVFVSSRQYEILNPTSSYGYGLDPEKAWNYGFNFVHNFDLAGREGSFAFDAYRTSFNNQTIVDLDADAQAIQFYNLSGKSYSNSIQTELNYELLPKFDVRLAYRWLEVKTTYGNTLLEKPFTAKHRAFVNLAYETQSKWKFDYTTQWLSSQRIPRTGANPIGLQLSGRSPSYFQMAAQISKQFGEKWEVYVGGENLTNYVQQDRIIDAPNPFGPYFDASMTWGPVIGRMAYVGMRFNIPQ